MVLFKPEKNTRDAVMTVMKQSSHRGDSVYRKQGQDHYSSPAVFVLNGELYILGFLMNQYIHLILTH